MGTTNNNISIKKLEEFFKNNGIETQSLIYAYEAKFNSQWWKTQFRKADTPLALTNGAGLFQMASIETRPHAIFKARASWTETDQSPKEGFNTYTGSIGQYAHGQSWSSQELAEFERVLKSAGGSNIVEMAYMKKVGDLLGGAHATITNLSAQLLSTGQFTSIGANNFTNEGKAEIKADRFVKAGAKAWQDKTADIIGKMQLTAKTLRDKTGYAGALSWKMDRETFNNVMLNEGVQKYLQGYAAGKIGLFNADYMPAMIGTVANFNEWASQVPMGNVYPIEIVEELQTKETGQTIREDVYGWQAGKAVLSPMGNQGEIKYAAVEELNWIDPMMCQLAYAENGLISIASYKILEGAYNKYHTNFYLHLAPALSVFDKMMIVDTKTTD